MSTVDRMAETNNGTESAFPTNFEADCETCQRQMVTTTPHPGLTKREYFAAMAMQGFIAAKINSPVLEAVEYADALLKELAK